MLFALILALVPFVRSQGCISYFTTDTGGSNITGGTAECGTHFVYSVNPDTIGFSVVTELDVSSPTSFTVNNQVIMSRIFNVTAIDFYQITPSDQLLYGNLSVVVDVFAYDNTTCTEYEIGSSAIRYTGFFGPLPLCTPTIDFYIWQYQAQSPINIVYPNTYNLPYYARIRMTPLIALNLSDPTVFVQMGEFIVDDSNLAYTQELSVGECQPPFAVPRFLLSTAPAMHLVSIPSAATK